jgi:hypothetical protein
MNGEFELKRKLFMRNIYELGTTLFIHVGFELKERFFMFRYYE